MSTNKYIDKLKAKIDHLTFQLNYWKMLANERNGYIIISELISDSRTVEEHVITEKDVRIMWKRIDEQAQLIRELLNKKKKGLEKNEAITLV